MINRVTGVRYEVPGKKQLRVIPQSRFSLFYHRGWFSVVGWYLTQPGDNKYLVCFFPSCAIFTTKGVVSSASSAGLYPRGVIEVRRVYLTLTRGTWRTHLDRRGG